LGRSKAKASATKRSKDEDLVGGGGGVGGSCIDCKARKALNSLEQGNQLMG